MPGPGQPFFHPVLLEFIGLDGGLHVRRSCGP